MCKFYCFMLLLLVIEPSEILVLEQKDICTWMFITVLFHIVTTRSKLPTTIGRFIKNKEYLFNDLL